MQRVVMLVEHRSHLAPKRGGGQAALQPFRHRGLQLITLQSVEVDARRRIIVMAAMLIENPNHGFWNRLVQ